MPNLEVYPFQWLWDSCFHAIVWAHLGYADHATRELRHLFRCQDSSGFVPHIDYEADPTRHADFWGRTGSSSITQPPMYGHALAELHRRDVAVDRTLLECATAGLRFLLDRRSRDATTGLVTIVHPWESGADDSPRWDHWRSDAADLSEWFHTKGRLLASVERSAEGAPLANPSFDPAPASFNALVAFNALELASITGDAGLRRAGDEITDRLVARWSASTGTWIDGGPASDSSGSVRVLDALLPALVCHDHAADAVRAALDPGQFGGAAGPAGVHREEPSFAPTRYWRGPAWPQLTYLLWVAAVRCSQRRQADALARALVLGARRSGFAEYWEPDTGAALGAHPQAWATLAAVVSPPA